MHGAMSVHPGYGSPGYAFCINCGSKFVPSQHAEIERLVRERDHWKANHDEQVRQKAAAARELSSLRETVKKLLDLVDDAYGMVEAYDPAGTSSSRKEIEGRRREQQEWIGRADALTSPEEVK